MLFHIQLFVSFGIILTNVVVSILYHAWCSVLCLDEAILNAFNDWDLFEKGAQLSVVVDVDNEESINDLQLRSRCCNSLTFECHEITSSTIYRFNLTPKHSESKKN